MSVGVSEQNGQSRKQNGAQPSENTQNGTHGQTRQNVWSAKHTQTGRMEVRQKQMNTE